MPLEVGASAPGFTLRDQHGTRVSSDDYRGERPMLLVFFPFAFTSVCSAELVGLRDRAEELAATGVQVLGISCDPMSALRVLDDRDRLGFPLLSDFWPHGEVADAFGVFDRDRGCARRSSFLVDPDGVVRWTVHNPMGEPRSVDEHLAEARRVAGRGSGK